MSRIDLGVATRDDDAGLRALVARNAVPGRMTIAYEREPDYFAGCETMGTPYQVLRARDIESGEVVGVSCRAERRAYVNGAPVDCAYLGQLRVDERYRGRWLVSRGFRMLRALQSERPCGLTIATIVDGSREAMGVLLEKPRSGFPAFQRIGGLNTFAIATRKRRVAPSAIIFATDDLMADVERFLERYGPARQLFPEVTEGALASGRRPRGLRAGDFLVAMGRDGARGTLAVWDQTAFKQTVIRGYRWTVRAARPVINLAASTTGRPRLPRVGERVRLAFASFVAVERDDPEIFAALLDAALDAARRRGIELLVVGHTDDDPLMTVTAARAHVVYKSHIFSVSWEQEGQHERLDGRPIYLDPATL